ncbi:P-loop containing nucleoside triphosphate hydrolase protein [Globomyces pollinis-pini]|nr:P-loop containing nucleoside triphosphate hydrolase protein [Globomyces pollinis-pini]
MHQLTLSLISLQSSFVNIPMNWASVLLDKQVISSVGLILQLNTKSSSVFVAWAGGSSSPLNGSETLEIDRNYAHALGLSHASVVSVKIINSCPIASSISVEPWTSDDWEIIELNAGYLEEQFLNQVRVVQKNQPLLIWLHNQATVRLRVVDLDPQSDTCVKLSNTTDVIVAPKERYKPEPVALPSSSQNKIVCGIYKSIPLEWSAKVQFSQLWDVGISSNQNYENNSIVYIQNFDYDHLVPDNTNKEGSETDPKKIALNGVFARCVKFDNIGENNIVLSQLPASILYTNVLSRVRLSSVPAPISIKSVIVTSGSVSSISSKHLVERLKDWLLQHLLDKKVILYHTQKVNLDFEDAKIPIEILFPTAEKAEKDSTRLRPPTYMMLESEDLSHIEFIHQVKSNLIAKPPLSSDGLRMPSALVGFEKIGKCCLDYFTTTILLNTKLKLGTKPSGGLHIHGSHGTGKTTLVEYITYKLSRDYHLFPMTIKCEQIKSYPLAKIRKIFDRLILQSIWHQPALIIFDDLDSLISTETENTSNVRVKQLAQIFLDSMRKIQSYPVYFIATTSDSQSIHLSITKSHIFGKSIHLKAPNKQQRISILRNLITKYISNQDVINNLNLEDICGRMDGYCIIDIKTLFEHSLQQSVLRRVENDDIIELTRQDFERAFESYKPMSLSGSKLETSTVAWDSIGGMKKTKQMLLETLQWPTLYPQIFQKSPLRLRSGILLYGYPGCGKTMLASAVAKECGLNFISVKGPELLNKYIGASEKAVRDLFERAKAAKPCCLFFDEFDSIAPRRGHDNSGVTDRVVNQLLTEMDGAEGLEGVYVLGATSRPDMIDPALLRPGRLDKSILCDLPSLEDRVDIINAVSKSIQLHSSVDVNDIASKTDGLTGADIQGLLYSAQLLAIHERMDYNQIVETKDESLLSKVIQGVRDQQIIHDDTSALVLDKSKSTAKAESQPILVDSTHLKNAMGTCRPSLSHDEYLNLRNDYIRFAGGEIPTNVGTKSSFQ